MRVSAAVREYVRKAVLAKVADKLKAAEEAAKVAKDNRDYKVEKAKELCKRLCAEAQAKFVKEVKKLGLTFIADAYRSDGSVDRNVNTAVTADVGHDSFVETLASRGLKAKCNPSAARDEFDRVVGEPERIRSAANAAADRLLFELELGKVAKGELDGLLKELEVEL